MTLRVSYMGTKRRLADDVALVVANCKPGPFLDVFSGMCSVATSVARQRNVWCNDIQTFAVQAATALFKSRWELPPTATVTQDIESFFRLNSAALSARFTRLLEVENRAFESCKPSWICECQEGIPSIANSQRLRTERRSLAIKPGEFPYRLFTITYAGSYLSLAQCIEIDSLRYAIDALLRTGRIAWDQRRWMLLALCQAMAKASTTTGHFAQPMNVKNETAQRFVAQRRRSILHEWRAALSDCAPIGTRHWRERNRTFQSDAVTLLCDLAIRRETPAVIYADPPYTADQYSRFYHLYETLLQYDYPTASGVGRYRSGRFVSDFSRAGGIARALEQLAGLSARLDSALVLSYPTDGLLPDSRTRIPSILKRHFRRVDIALEKQHSHSSFGASKGAQHYAVTEVIYLAQ